ncbi:AAA family ATPase, partial [Sinorhizobium meliloti]
MPESKIDVLLNEIQKLSAAMERIAGPAYAINNWHEAEC